MWLHTYETTNDMTNTIAEIEMTERTGLNDMVFNPNLQFNCSIISACAKYAPKLYFDSLAIIVCILSLIFRASMRFLKKMNTPGPCSMTFKVKLPHNI